MAAPEMITISMRELDRLKTVQAVVEKHLKPGAAAERLNLSDRQLRRLVADYRISGPSALINKHRGRPSNRQLSAGVESRVFSIIRERYADFGPTLACEKLKECHGIDISIETVRRIMMDGKLWTPRKQRPPKIYQPRNRRDQSNYAVVIYTNRIHAWLH